ncbi:hypothetical protein BC941DRAFT_183950 [Chlamydoabsidia padenii]|nr:hypothetical protein BC941DRAFT_183950 [Chlamydoabsidia padenii]
MMGDQGSSYSVLQDIPVMVSPQYRLPKQIVIDHELLTIPEDALALAPYSFSVERQAISNVVGLREKQAMEQKILTERLETYKTEKLQQKRAAARKIAPGFLDTDTRILHPQPYQSNKTLITDSGTDSDSEKSDNSRMMMPEEDRLSSTHSSPHLQHQQQQQQQQQRLSPYQRFRSSSNPPDFGSPPVSHIPQEKRASAQSHFDYLKFEQGLAPPDPWDTPENDMVALRSILGSQETKEHHPSPSMPANSSMPTNQYNSPYQQQQQQQHYHAINNNSNTIYPPDGPWIRPPPSIHTPPPPPPPPPLPSTSSSTPYFAPAIPPKLFKEDHPNEQTVNRNHPQSPPPLPPQPVSSVSSPQQDQQQQQQHSTNDALVQELANMGFSHAQATDALMKNENDLVRATHFLLDNN